MRIEVDCERLRRNTEAVVALCKPHGIEVVGVTKACCGHPDIARAMLAGGAGKLAESRLGNVRRLRQAGIEAEIMLLRLPAISEADEVVRLTQVSLNSQVETVRALSRAASAQGVAHRVILMLETGDRREGVTPERALEAARGMVGLPNIALIGMGANTTCIGGVLPTRENTQLLVDTAEMVERQLGIHFQTFSAGNSASLALLLRDEMPARANQLRIGGAIMIGEVDSTNDWPDALPHQDAFTVRAEVIEVEVKPSAPEGRLAPNAFGDIPHWPDLGARRRAILALGRQDLQIESLIPKRPGVTILGASSDHLVLDVTEASPPVHTGEQMEFRPLYGAVATGMASAVAQQVILKIRD
ncbi:MAG: alanine/ornithine racemase family PLP-dependent enzyme [Chloroflexota bacterium]